MSIDRAEVERIAELARLELRGPEVERLATELSAILEFMSVLRRLDLAGCEPTDFAPPAAPLREDELDPRRLGAERALAAAPERDGDFFLVPPIVENVNP